MSATREVPSDELILAAISRAEQHGRTKTCDISRGEVLQHLALFNSRTKRPPFTPILMS